MPGSATARCRAAGSCRGWPAFRSNLRPILLLAVGGVLFTAVVVGASAKLLLPDLPLAAAIALGAIVAPPDAVAAASVLKDFRIPKRLVTVLEGESLLNDASSLVLYRFAVASAATGAASFGEASLQFVLSAVGGTVVEYLIGRAAMWVFLHLEDTLLGILVTFLAGFAAYLVAEQVHASGVLAAVACGLVLGRQQHSEFTARTIGSVVVGHRVKFRWSEWASAVASQTGQASPHPSAT